MRLKHIIGAGGISSPNEKPSDSPSSTLAIRCYSRKQEQTSNDLDGPSQSDVAWAVNPFVFEVRPGRVLPSQLAGACRNNEEVYL